MPLISFPLKQVWGYMGQYVIHFDLIGELLCTPVRPSFLFRKHLKQVGKLYILKQLHLLDNKTTFLSLLHFLHHIRQVFSESQIFEMVRRKLMSRHRLRMSNFDRMRSRFNLNFEQQEHPKQYHFFMPSCSRVNVVSPVKADSHMTTQCFGYLGGTPGCSMWIRLRKRLSSKHCLLKC